MLIYLSVFPAHPKRVNRYMPERLQCGQVPSMQCMVSASSAWVTCSSVQSLAIPISHFWLPHCPGTVWPLCADLALPAHSEQAGLDAFRVLLTHMSMALKPELAARLADTSIVLAFKKQQRSPQKLLAAAKARGLAAGAGGASADSVLHASMGSSSAAELSAVAWGAFSRKVAPRWAGVPPATSAGH